MKDVHASEERGGEGPEARALHGKVAWKQPFEHSANRRGAESCWERPRAPGDRELVNKTWIDIDENEQEYEI